MRKVSVFFILLILMLFFLKPLVFAAENSSCTASVSPSEGIAGETRFSISGNISNFPPNAGVSLRIIDTKKNVVVSYPPLSLTLDPNNSGQFDPIELDPFNLPSEYIARIYFVTTVRGTIYNLLCSSNTFTVNPSLTPTKLECDPPGRDPKDQSKCRDPRCTPTGRYQCLLSALEIVNTPIPTPSLPQCAEWANLQGTPIPTPQLDYIEQHEIETTDLKCIAVGTAVGNIKTEPFGFVKSILSILLSLAGGIAVLLIIVSGYRLMTSQGNPEAVQAAREQLTSAIVGFLFIIFSLVLLEVIGVNILHIPGFQ